MTSVKTERFVSKPEYLEVVKVTYANIEDIAEWLGADQIETYRRKGKPTVVTFDGEDIRPVRCEVEDFVCHTSDGQVFTMTYTDLFAKFERAESVRIS